MRPLPGDVKVCRLVVEPAMRELCVHLLVTFRAKRADALNRAADSQQLQDVSARVEFD